MPIYITASSYNENKDFTIFMHIAVPDKEPLSPICNQNGKWRLVINTLNKYGVKHIVCPKCVLKTA